MSKPADAPSSPAAPLAEGYAVTFKTSQPFYGVTHGWHILLFAIKIERGSAA